MKKSDKVVIIMPAYNAARTLENVYLRIPEDLKKNLLLCDDGSKDGTVEVAKKLKIETLIHQKNLGYGINQKTCYKKALKDGADFVVMLHPDGQYDPKDLPKFVKSWEEKKGDLVLGSRFLEKGDKETPFYKAISIKIITFLYNLVLGINLTEVNTGYRGFSRNFLEKIPFEKNGSGYIFDPQIIIQARFFGFKISEVPVSKIYNKEASSPNLSKSIIHGLENINLLVQYLGQKTGLRKADFLSLN